MEGVSRSDLSDVVLRLGHGIRNPLVTMQASADLVRRLGGLNETSLSYLSNVVAEVRRIDEILSRAESRPPTEMLLGLSHDIRNPLATIQSSVQLVLRIGEPDEKSRPYLERIVNEVRRLHRMLNVLEMLARLEEAEPGDVDVAEAVSEALDVVGAEAKAAEIRLVDAGDANLTLHVDAELLGTAIRELLSNAVRFSGAGSTTTVRWERGEDGTVAIHVDDEGSGVSEDHAESILQPFFTTSSAGTGLGLPLVDRICRGAGGELRWRARSGGGCRFSLVLPRSRHGAVSGR